MPVWLVPLLKSKWFHYALFALALAGTWGWGKIGWRDAASWKLASQTQANSYRAAQASAQAQAIAQKLATEARYRAQAEKTDHDYQTALAHAQSSASAYAERMRVNSTRAAGNTPATADDHGAAVSQDAAPAAVLVSHDDFDICTENSVKIEQAWEWAAGLNQP